MTNPARGLGIGDGGLGIVVYPVHGLSVADPRRLAQEPQGLLGGKNQPALGLGQFLEPASGLGGRVPAGEIQPAFRTLPSQDQVVAAIPFGLGSIRLHRHPGTYDAGIGTEPGLATVPIDQNAAAVIFHDSPGSQQPKGKIQPGPGGNPCARELKGDLEFPGEQSGFAPFPQAGGAGMIAETARQAEFQTVVADQPFQPFKIGRRHRQGGAGKQVASPFPQQPAKRLAQPFRRQAEIEQGGRIPGKGIQAVATGDGECLAGNPAIIQPQAGDSGSRQSRPQPQPLEQDRTLANQADGMR